MRHVMSDSKRAIALVALTVLGVAATLAWSLASHHVDSAGARGTVVRHAAAVPAVATRNAALQTLKDDKPTMDLTRAYQAVADDQGTLWVVPSVDSSQLCVVEVPSDRSVIFRFVCNDAATVNEDGLVGGTPGDWFGYAPPSPDAPQARRPSGVQTLSVTNNVFRLPADATTTTVGGKTISLPAPLK